MNALPKRETETARSANAGTELLASALTQQAEVRSQQQRRRERIETARSVDSADFLFTWQTQDGRDADLRIYYDPRQDAEVIAAELVLIDFREPTVQEQLRYEDEFEAELADAGELWSRVASHIWERAR